MGVFHAETGKAIPLGRLGENMYTRIAFPISQYQAEYHDAHYTLFNRRPNDAAAYAANNTSVDGGYLYWDVTSADLTRRGVGACELMVMQDEVVIKSEIYLTSIAEALDGSGNPPDPWESWLEQFAELAGDAEAAAESAASAATDAEAASQAVQDMSAASVELEPGSTPTVIKTVDPVTGAITLTFGQVPGRDGQPGYTPTVTITEITGGHRITITDADGAHIVDVMDGATGATGNGIASTVMNADYSLTITYTNGQTYTTPSIRGEPGAQGPQGQTGQDGNDGTSAYVYIRYAAAQPTQDSDMKTTPDAWIGIYSGDAASAPTHYMDYTWYKIKGETGPVSDVQVNGTSVVSGGVANVPAADSNNYGAVKIGGNAIVLDQNGRFGVNTNSSYGVRSYSNSLALSEPSINEIKQGTTYWKAISPKYQDTSTFYGLARAAGDSTQPASSNAVGNYTESAKSAISEMLGGSVAVTGTTPTIAAKPGIRYVCGECATLAITVPATGIIDVVFTSGSTPTVLTVTPPSGVTAVKWAGGFDPTALETNTVYHLTIIYGKYGSVQSWA